MSMNGIVRIKTDVVKWSYFSQAGLEGSGKNPKFGRKLIKNNFFEKNQNNNLFISPKRKNTILEIG